MKVVVMDIIMAAWRTSFHKMHYALLPMCNTACQFTMPPLFPIPRLQVSLGQRRDIATNGDAQLIRAS